MLNLFKFTRTQLAKFCVRQTHIIMYLRGAPSSHFRVLIKNPLNGKVCLENDLSVAPIGLSNLKYDQLWLYL
jgi:hypothetical protein